MKYLKILLSLTLILTPFVKPANHQQDFNDFKVSPDVEPNLLCWLTGKGCDDKK